MINKKKGPKRNKFKLYVWTDFNPDYTSGLAVALARNRKEAEKAIESKTSVYDWGDLEVFPVTKKMAESVNGGG